MQAIHLIQKVGHAMSLHGKMASLVCHGWIRHAVHGAVRRHHQANILPVFPGNIAEHSVALNDTCTRRRSGTIQKVVKQALGIFPGTKHTHLWGFCRGTR